MPDAPTLLARGVHRLGNAFVNCYLMEDGNRMTLVDGGLPRAFAADACQSLASLEALERIDAGVTLFGHGEPWTDGPAAAVARAREVGVT